MPLPEQVRRKIQYGVLKLKWSEKGVTQGWKCIYIFKICMCVGYTHKALLLRPSRSGSNNISIKISTSHVQNSCLLIINFMRGGGMADSKAGARPNKLGKSCAKGKTVL